MKSARVRLIIFLAARLSVLYYPGHSRDGGLTRVRKDRLRARRACMNNVITVAVNTVRRGAPIFAAAAFRATDEAIPTIGIAPRLVGARFNQPARGGSGDGPETRLDAVKISGTIVTERSRGSSFTLIYRRVKIF